MTCLHIILIPLACLSGASFLAAQDSVLSIRDQTLTELRHSLDAEAYPRELPGRPVHFWRPGPLLTTGQPRPSTPPGPVAAPVPRAWAYEELAFFCKLEVKMEKALRLPIKVRLGEVQYVERMEGKLKSYLSR